MSSPNIRRFAGLIKAAGFIANSLKSITATATATRASNAGRTNLLKKAAGLTVTLPAATGSGAVLRFVVGTLLTSGNYIIKVADGTDIFVGGIFMNDIGDSAAATADFFPTAATSDTLTLNQAIGAGKIGDWVEFEDVALNTWAVRGTVQGVTDPSTPFSATVA